jgi:glycosyltransferase involved in cell wall biosynthesis
MEYFRRQKSATSPEDVTAAHIWAGKELCRRVIRRGFEDSSSVYTYSSAGLELLEYARERGLRTITEQASSPTWIFAQLLHEEEAAYPEWRESHAKGMLLGAFEERERREWSAAATIICGSEFVREGIRKVGGPVERCVVVPYGIRTLYPVTRRSQKNEPLRVLVVGAVRIMKGPHYTLAVAKAMSGRAEFRVAGQLDVTPHAQKLLSEHVTLLGAVPRSEIHRQFEWADVFLLPTLCEGSATVCYEALSHGLPVITTPNAGSVVRDGVDGFIVPIRDAAAIVERIERFLDDGDLLATMSENALARAAEYTLERYGERLLSALALYSVREGMYANAPA